MGYTRYWNRTEKKIDADLIVKVCEVIADCDKKGIMIRNGWGQGNPLVTLDYISINGDRSNDLDHESFFISDAYDDKGFNFCKTARKPYDYAVREILKYAEENGFVTDVQDDGDNDEIISDEDYLKKYGR